MKRITSTFAAIALTASFAAAPAFAVQDPAPQPAPEQQQPAPEQQQPAPAPADVAAAATATGELTKVDPDAMTITIEDVEGKEWTFRYTADTEVAGDTAGMAGLATQAGTTVTVHFEGEGDARTATKIEVAG